MTRRLFGTDGVRGTANREPMTAETALRLGTAAGRLFRRQGHGHRVVIGKDTRLSGYMLEPALTAGLISTGMSVILTGPLPTPGIAFLTRSLRADLGVMISASHNHYADNGIKFFGPDGYKLSDALEAEVERLVGEPGAAGLVAPAELGRAQRIEDARGRYIEHLKGSLPKGFRLEGLRIAIDAANGAAYHIAADLFWELGAEVVRLGNQPNGFNINDGCGSTHPAAVARAVLEHRADVGLALDGDADRLALVDERGRVVDGDQVLALLALSWQEQGRLARNTVVGTVMANLGLGHALAAHGIDLVRTKVGDRYVVEAMRAKELNLGGEPSGHLVLGDHATTGDGLLAALQLLTILRAKGRPMGDLAQVFRPIPQKLVNLPLGTAVDLAQPALAQAIAGQAGRLGSAGRLLVRASGTEPLIRIMVETEDEALMAEVVAEVTAALDLAARRAG